MNAHFGDWGDVSKLSREMHARGMRYIQDIRLDDSNPLDNHICGRLFDQARRIGSSLTDLRVLRVTRVQCCIQPLYRIYVMNLWTRYRCAAAALT
ncbi:MAG: hypothetical protein JO138_23170 [Acidobacteriaceae bacterium]|nr:hypothetical protein [Acidobacteriaceae bacterium]